MATALRTWIAFPGQQDSCTDGNGSMYPPLRPQLPWWIVSSGLASTVPSGIGVWSYYQNWYPSCSHRALSSTDCSSDSSPLPVSWSASQTGTRIPFMRNGDPGWLLPGWTAQNKRRRSFLTACFPLWRSLTAPSTVAAPYQCSSLQAFPWQWGSRRRPSRKLRLLWSICWRSSRHFSNWSRSTWKMKGGWMRPSSGSAPECADHLGSQGRCF